MHKFRYSVRDREIHAMKTIEFLSTKTWYFDLLMANYFNGLIQCLIIPSSKPFSVWRTFYAYTFYGEQFHESIWRRQEMNVSKYPTKEEI